MVFGPSFSKLNATIPNQHPRRRERMVSLRRMHLSDIDTHVGTYTLTPPAGVCCLLPQRRCFPTNPYDRRHLPLPLSCVVSPPSLPQPGSERPLLSNRSCASFLRAPESRGSTTIDTTSCSVPAMYQHSNSVANSSGSGSRASRISSISRKSQLVQQLLHFPDPASSNRNWLA